MEELWKPITCLNHIEDMRTNYEASNLGRIRNKRTKRIVQPHNHNTGYQTFNYRYLDDNGKIRFTCMLWPRVIAMTWIPNPDDLPQVDHIDRDVTNNSIENLRWVTAKVNAQNTGPRSKIRYSRSRETRIIDREGNVVETFPTLEDACRAYNVSVPHAFEMMHGRRLPKSWGTFQQDLPEKK